MAIDDLHGISDKAKMELVSFLQPFFESKHRTGVQTTRAVVSGGGPSQLLATFDNGGYQLPVGIIGDAPIEFACKIVGWVMVSDLPGSLVLDIWKAPYASFPPTVTNSIVASSYPSLSSAVKNQDTALAGWTTAITAGDILRFNLNSASGQTRIALALELG